MDFERWLPESAREVVSLTSLSRVVVLSDKQQVNATNVWIGAIVDSKDVTVPQYQSNKTKIGKPCNLPIKW
jgi:hypothetical protein